jgi:hypothetical protein
MMRTKRPGLKSNFVRYCPKADIRVTPINVRYWGKADMDIRVRDFRSSHQVPRTVGLSIN